MLHKKELCDLYRSADIVRVMTCKIVGWTVYVAGTDITKKNELCDLYRSADIVRVTTCEMLRWAGYVARMDITQK